MSQTAVIQKTISIAGISMQTTDQVEADEAHSVVSEVPVAQPGSLTTRTDNNTGILTMTNSDHGIPTAAKVDLYWDGGTRRNVTVGTVSGTSVPIDLGSGDNLPIATTAIVAAVPVVNGFPLTVADLKAIACSGNFEGQIYLMEADGTTEDWYVHLDPAVANATDGEEWHEGDGASPLTGTTVATVRMSHADPDSVHILQAAFMSS